MILYVPQDRNSGVVMGGGGVLTQGSDLSNQSENRAEHQGLHCKSDLLF